MDFVNQPEYIEIVKMVAGIKRERIRNKNVKLIAWSVKKAKKMINELMQTVIDMIDNGYDKDLLELYIYDVLEVSEYQSDMSQTIHEFIESRLKFDADINWTHYV